MLRKHGTSSAHLIPSLYHGFKDFKTFLFSLGICTFVLVDFFGCAAITEMSLMYKVAEPCVMTCHDRGGACIYIHVPDMAHSHFSLGQNFRLNFTLSQLPMVWAAGLYAHIQGSMCIYCVHIQKIEDLTSNSPFTCMCEWTAGHVSEIL